MGAQLAPAVLLDQNSSKAEQLKALQDLLEGEPSEGHVSVVIVLGRLRREAAEEGIQASILSSICERAESADPKYRLLLRHYSGIRGTVVFALGTLTILPLLLPLKSDWLTLSLSPATIVYGIYHGYGISVWIRFFQLRHVKEGFDREEQDLEVEVLNKRHKVVQGLYWVVVVLILLTFVAKVNLTFGDDAVSGEGLFSPWILAVLGVS